MTQKIQHSLQQRLRETVQQTRFAQRRLSSGGRDLRKSALQHLADGIRKQSSALLAANRLDLEAASELEIAEPLVKRLSLDEAKLQVLADGVDQLIGADDPVGSVLRHTELDEGLVLKQVSSPIGILLVIFESRPGAVIQIGSLAIQTGNAVILKGGSEAKQSNRILVQLLQDSLEAAGLDRNAVTLVEGREAVAELLALDHAIDLVIPRGSSELVRTIQNSTRIPVMGHAEGICHLYLDQTADPAMAERLAIDGKCGYPAACNATETLLVHEGYLSQLPKLVASLVKAGVRIKADKRGRANLAGLKVEAANLEDWSTEWGDLTLSLKVVGSFEEARDHIHQHGSGHTEAIVTEDSRAAQRFTQEIDAASVFVNASTRFADGYRYGLGAEVGISTGRIHARGPVGAEGLLTTRWLLSGEGQTVAEYGGPTGRQFTHRNLAVTGT